MQANRDMSVRPDKVYPNGRTDVLKYFEQDKNRLGPHAKATSKRSLIFEYTLGDAVPSPSSTLDQLDPIGLKDLYCPKRHTGESVHTVLRFDVAELRRNISTLSSLDPAHRRSWYRSVSLLHNCYNGDEADYCSAVEDPTGRARTLSVEHVAHIFVSEPPLCGPFESS